MRWLKMFIKKSAETNVPADFFYQLQSLIPETPPDHYVTGQVCNSIFAVHQFHKSATQQIRQLRFQQLNKSTTQQFRQLSNSDNSTIQQLHNLAIY